MTNLPPDWNSFYQKCPRCEKRYHASGTDDCDCDTCEECNSLFYDPAYMLTFPMAILCQNCRKCSMCGRICLEEHIMKIDGIVWCFDCANHFVFW